MRDIIPGHWSAGEIRRKKMKKVVIVRNKVRKDIKVYVGNQLVLICPWYAETLFWMERYKPLVNRRPNNERHNTRRAIEP